MTGQQTATGEPPAPVELTGLVPGTVLPYSTLALNGRNFSTSDAVSHTMRIAGQGGQGEVGLSLPIRATSVERAELVLDDGLFADLGGEGVFTGTVQVVSKGEYGESSGPELPVRLYLVRHLSPKLKAVGSGLVHLNTRVKVEGEGLLLGGKEGSAQAELQGCFLPTGAQEPCATSGKAVSAKVTLDPQSEGDRQRGSFEFSPSIVGIRTGSFNGTIRLVNSHFDGKTETSATLPATFQLDRTRIESFGQATVSLGQYVDIKGAGFVGGTGNTIIRFEGTVTPHGGTAKQTSFDVATSYQDGGWIRHVVEENQGLGQTLNARTTWGVFSGTWTPRVIWGTEQAEGYPASLSIKLASIKQVVWVRFGQGWSESLRLFGLTAADASIRQRVLTVMRAVYAGINMDFRDVEPADFKLYAKVDLTGKDPNGQGLLGYDNTVGKDVENKRLYDWLGGVNALTQQDGYPGYGGVFLESLLGFSLHPPSGVAKSPIANELFDQIFDPFRPGSGSELTSAEALSLPVLSSTQDECPAQERLLQASCAVAVLGNVIGSTTAHELGHSLGLANPYGELTEFHNPGDLPNRLMEAGSDRPFEERAELSGQGPAVFCTDEYTYLKKILPLEKPNDPKVTRPACD